MEFLTHLIQTPEFISWMALSAFLFSILSLLWTRKSVKISQSALDESKANNQRISESETEQKRLELLKEISSEHEMLQRILTNIGALKADFDLCPETVKKLMSDRSTIFTSTMPLLEKYKYEVEARHLGATNWKLENGIPELMRLLSEQDVATKNTRHSVECNISVVAEFREKLQLAKNYPPGALVE
jgi:pyruvate formate-lyase activating enzyme-like uncharacterized protein